MRFCLGLAATNEEKMLERFLPGLSEAFNGNVVAIDYGSSDRTAEILQKYCEKSNTMEWPRNFGEAKTNVIKLAEALSYDWMFLIDADETIKTEDVEVMRNCIETNNYDMYFMPRLHFRDENFIEGHLDRFPDMQARLFKLNMGYCYKNVRHCSLFNEADTLTAWELKRGPVLPIFIRHYKMTEPKESQMLDEIKRLAMDFGFPEVTKIETEGNFEKCFEPMAGVNVKI